MDKRNRWDHPGAFLENEAAVVERQITDAEWLSMRKKETVDIHSLNPLIQPKMAERIVNALVDYISSAQLPAGHKLPSEKELSDILHVGNRSLREALMIMQALGVVQSKHGAGWFVDKFDPTTSLRILSPIFEKFSGSDMFQILDTRLTIEPRIAYLAAENISEDGLKKFTEIMDTMLVLGPQIEKQNELTEMYDTYRMLDQQFHDILAYECQNNILAMLSTVLRGAFVTVHFRIPVIRIQPPLQHHQNIFEAVKAGQAQAAERAMRVHLADTLDFYHAHTDLMR